MLALLGLAACSEADHHGAELHRDAGVDAPAPPGPLDAGRADAQASSPGPRDASGELCVPLSTGDGCSAGPSVPLEDAGSSEQAGDAGVSCDARDVLCKSSPPKCPDGQFPAVLDSCWGACVRFDRCVCHAAAECPQPEQYTCHMSAAHCGPYVN